MDTRNYAYNFIGYSFSVYLKHIIKHSGESNRLKRYRYLDEF